jgi:photosystem II stability/assembly factor-like uncharacterized protein
MLLRRAVCQLILLALLAFPAVAGNYRWTIQGPDGGTIERLEFDPADSSIVYAASTNGLFRSIDGGQHWDAAAELLGRYVFDVAVTPSDPQKVYASTTFGLYRSVDRGLTWQIVHPFASFDVEVSRGNPSIVYSNASSGPIRSSDGGVTFSDTGIGLPESAGISAMAVDPQNPDVVYVSLLSSDGVYKSVDGGAHCTAANTGLTATFYYSIIVDPSNGGTLYLGGAGSIYKSTNGAATWSALSGAGSVYCYALAIQPGTPSMLIAGTNLGVLKSTNTGSSWTTPKLGSLSAVAIDPIQPANLLVVAYSNVFRSTDGGGTYALAGSGLTSHFTQSIAIDPQNESTVYTAGPGGIFKSIDRGQTWTSPSATELFPTGPATQIIAVDPFDSSILYIVSSGSVWRSVDGGHGIVIFATGLPGGFASP